jgi:anaphase-promoting complex subunit 1
MVLTQIGKGPLNNKNSDRESYTLAAGLALGLVNLGSGSSLPGMSDLNIDERLIRFIEGGKRMDELPSMKPTNEGEKCSSVKEGSNVNLYVTLPGAIMALTFIHLKSNNHQIADRIELPQTFHSLEYSRPKDVLLKVLCKNLILWDSIKPTVAWIESQIPDIIRFIFNEPKIENIEKQYQTRVSIDEIDFSSIAVLHTYLLSGALFSLGFKYAGSGNNDVFKFLNKYIEKIISLNSERIQTSLWNKYTDRNKNDIDRNTYET